MQEREREREQWATVLWAQAFLAEQARVPPLVTALSAESSAVGQA